MNMIQGTIKYCENKECQKPFQPNPRNVKVGQGRFCCSKCYGSSLKIPLVKRFWSYVNKDGPIPKHAPELGHCWIWMGAKTGSEYGSIRDDNKKNKSAHRVSWELQNSTIANEECVLHKCDNPPCVNPHHLFLGTKKDNANDAVIKGRNSRGEKNGHSILTEDNVRSIRILQETRQLSDRGIARSLKLPWNAVRAVLEGKTWKHVTL